MDLGDSRQDVVLVSLSEIATLSLAATNQPSEFRDRASGEFALCWGLRVVRRRKKFLCHIEPGIDRYTEVAETAGTDIQSA